MRLEGRSKAGFYPTPPLVVEMIASHVRLNGSRHCRFLDPCCGTGEPLEHIARTFGIEGSYGVELDRKRAEISRQRLTKVVHESYTNLRTPEKAYSLLFLNPPYDVDEEHNRLEHKFLIETTKYLAQGGILIFIIPHNRLIAKTARYLSFWYEDIKVMRFPDDEYKSFKQIVIFATKKEKYCSNNTIEQKLKRVIITPKEDLRIIEKSSPEYVLPGVNGRFWFRSRNLDPMECCEEIQQFGLWNDKQIDDILFPKSGGVLRPLMPLRKGHLAMLIGAGLMDNLEVSKGERRLLIKGRTEKKVRCSEVETKNTTTRTETDYVVTTVNALDLHTGELLTIK